MQPDLEPSSPVGMANERGLRHGAIELDDLQGAVDRLVSEGYGLVGRTGRHRNMWILAYVRGPEGTIVALAEKAKVEQERLDIEVRKPAEADATSAEGLAEARATDAKAEALKKYGDAALASEIIARLPEITRAVSEPLGNIKNLTGLDLTALLSAATGNKTPPAGTTLSPGSD